MHRWTATELQQRWTDAGETREVINAHRRAADYWTWRVDVWPQPPSQDIDDLREAHHHHQEATELGDHDAVALLAASAHQLETRLGKLGRRAEALAYCQQAVDLKRTLVRDDEQTHIRDLTGFLSNLGASAPSAAPPPHSAAAGTEWSAR